MIYCCCWEICEPKRPGQVSLPRRYPEARGTTAIADSEWRPVDRCLGFAYERPPAIRVPEHGQRHFANFPSMGPSIRPIRAIRPDVTKCVGRWSDYGLRTADFGLRVAGRVALGYGFRTRCPVLGVRTLDAGSYRLICALDARYLRSLVHWASLVVPK